METDSNVFEAQSSTKNAAPKRQSSNYDNTLEQFEENDKTLWRDRTFLQDITQTWQNKFVDFSSRVA